MGLAIPIGVILATVVFIEYTRRKAIKYYEDMRDRQDFTTEWGKTVIDACNEEINRLRYFERKWLNW